MIVRNCLYCAHCYLSEGSPGYSEMTPSSPMRLECLKGFWDLDKDNVSKKSLAEMLEMAGDCREFQKDTP